MDTPASTGRQLTLFLMPPTPPTTGVNGAAPTFSSAGFPASLSQSLAAEKARQITAICGRILHASSASSVPAPSSWKTYRRSLRPIVTSASCPDTTVIRLPGFESPKPASARPMRLKSYTTFPKWGTSVHGVLSALPTPERLTTAPAGGAWPTPMSQDTRNRQPGTVHQTKTGTIRHVNPEGKQSLMRLSQVVQLWPTVVSWDRQSRGTGAKNRALYGTGDTLQDAIKKWPTPAASNIKHMTITEDATEKSRKSPSLPTEVKVWIDGIPNGQLNPDWMDMLMGLPAGWSSLSGPRRKVSINTTTNRRARRKTNKIGPSVSKRSAIRSSQKSPSHSRRKSLPSYTKRIKSS